MWGLELSTAQWWSVIAVIVGIPVATYYPFMFLRIRWYKSDIGRSMLLKGVAIASVFWAAIGTIASVIFTWTWYDWVQTAANWLLVIAVYAQVFVMRRVQRSGEINERMGVASDDDRADA